MSEVQDLIVEETHRIRRELADEFNSDVHAFFEYLRAREKQADNVVSLDPVAPSVPASGFSPR